MPANPKLLAVILGGGAGNRLFPLTQQRSKPGSSPRLAKYRLVDIAAFKLHQLRHPAHRSC
jgi:glucose-1-phosphate adenylyltransferase